MRTYPPWRYHDVRAFFCIICLHLHDAVQRYAVDATPEEHLSIRVAPALDTYNHGLVATLVRVRDAAERRRGAARVRVRLLRLAQAFRRASLETRGSSRPRRCASFTGQW